MQPFGPHAHFFSSLKQVEKRLKLESTSSSSSSSSSIVSPPPPPPAEKCSDTQIDSLSTPMYLHCDQLTTDTTAAALQESEPPQEFLSNSPDFPPTQKDSLQGKNKLNGQMLKGERNDLDEIALLMELLALSDVEGQGKTKRVGFDLGCDDEFYGKIVGVKGPKSAKQVERLEAWIKHFSKDGAGAGEVKEPLRLAHLLLCKAAFLNSLEGSDGFGRFEFPSTIDEFLLNDPPID